MKTPYANLIGVSSHRFGGLPFLLRVSVRIVSATHGLGSMRASGQANHLEDMRPGKLTCIAESALSRPTFAGIQRTCTLHLRLHPSHYVGPSSPSNPIQPTKPRPNFPHRMGGLAPRVQSIFQDKRRFQNEAGLRIFVEKGRNCMLHCFNVSGLGKAKKDGQLFCSKGLCPWGDNVLK